METQRAASFVYFVSGGGGQKRGAGGAGGGQLARHHFPALSGTGNRGSRQWLVRNHAGSRGRCQSGAEKGAGGEGGADYGRPGGSGGVISCFTLEVSGLGLRARVTRACSHHDRALKE